MTDDRRPGAAPLLDAPFALRLRGPMHVYTAAGLRPAGRALVLLAAPDADPRVAALALDAIERAHADAAGDLFAAPVARGRHEGREFLALDADAAFDGERLLQRLADEGARVPYAAALGGLLRLADGFALAALMRSMVAFTALAAAMASEAAAPAPGERRVADDAAWFELDGGPRRGLASRASLRRLLAALVDAHRGGAGAVLAPAALLAAGWPGERVLPEAGTHRVHVAVAELRKMGLRGALERFDAGYRLAPALVVRRAVI